MYEQHLVIWPSIERFSVASSIRNLATSIAKFQSKITEKRETCSKARTSFETQKFVAMLLRLTRATQENVTH